MVRRVLRRPVLALSGCKLELLADPQQLLNEVRACAEVVPLEGAAALDDRSTGLPERAGRLGADLLLLRRVREDGSGESLGGTRPACRRGHP